jgi:hypothetical protein
VYRVRVSQPVPNSKEGYGPTEILALSAPIYARDYGKKELDIEPTLDQMRPKATQHLPPVYVPKAKEETQP